MKTWDPNTTVAYLYQKSTNSSEIVMVWERADIQDMDELKQLGEYRFIGTCNYNTNTHMIVD